MEFEKKEWRNGVVSACRSMRVCSLDPPDVVLAVRPPGRPLCRSRVPSRPGSRSERARTESAWCDLRPAGKERRRRASRMPCCNAPSVVRTGQSNAYWRTSEARSASERLGTHGGPGTNTYQSPAQSPAQSVVAPNTFGFLLILFASTAPFILNRSVSFPTFSSISDWSIVNASGNFFATSTTPSALNPSVPSKYSTARSTTSTSTTASTFSCRQYSWEPYPNACFTAFVAPASSIPRSSSMDRHDSNAAIDASGIARSALAAIVRVLVTRARTTGLVGRPRPCLIEAFVFAPTTTAPLLAAVNRIAIICIRT